MRSNILYIAALLPIFFGCAETQIKVESNPDSAEISFAESTHSSSKIGLTPMVISSQQYPELQSKIIKMQISKKGYIPTLLLLSGSSIGEVGTVKVTLQPSEESKIDQEIKVKPDETGYEELARNIADAQWLLIKRRSPEARKILEPLITKWPYVATLHTLLGNAFYSEKNVEQALLAYEKAQSLQPDNPTVKKLIEKLSQMRGKPKRENP